MAIQVEMKVEGGKSHHYFIDRDADSCPVCLREVHPIRLTAVRMNSSSRAQISYRCPSSHCSSLFISYFIDSGSGYFSFQRSAPKTHKPPTFPETVESVSPMFVSIMNQVEHAESLALDQLVGIGLRKALEFLVKDYVSSLKPAESESIRATMLSQCIQLHVDDASLKACAKRAAWLGNDETHYVRKWESKDVNDLKTLVRLCVNWIDTSLLTAKYQAEME